MYSYPEQVRIVRDELIEYLKDEKSNIEHILVAFGLCTLFFSYDRFNADLAAWFDIEHERMHQIDPDYAAIMRSDRRDGFYIYDEERIKTPAECYEAPDLYRDEQGHMRLRILNFILDRYDES